MQLKVMHNVGVARSSFVLCAQAMLATHCIRTLNTHEQVVCEVDGRTEVDIKRYVRVEKIPGGMLFSIV
jgi:hypothetical protein